MPAGPGGLDARGVYKYGEADNLAPASDLLNLLATSASTQFGADRTRLGTLEGGVGRGTKAVYYVANPAALQAISTKAIGDLAVMSNPGVIDFVIWLFDSGNWINTGIVKAPNKAAMDGFITAVNAQANLDFAPGSFWFDVATGVTYQFLTGAGTYRIAAVGNAIFPATCNVGGGSRTFNPDGSIDFVAASGFMYITNPFPIAFRHTRITIDGTQSVAGTINANLVAGGAEANSGKYDRQSTYSDGPTVASNLGVAQQSDDTKWVLTQYTVTRHRIVLELYRANMAENTLGHVHTVSTNATSGLTTMDGDLHHEVATVYDGITLYPNLGVFTGRVTFEGFN